MSDASNAVRQFIQDNFLFGQPATFADDESFLQLGIIDSTGVLELVAFLESEFNIHVGDDELTPENLDSIDNLVHFIEMKGACTCN